MTTPNQSLPQTVETLLGFGAFEIGGGTYKYGQNLTEDIATTLIRGGSNLLIGAFTSVEGFLVALGAYLNTLPLEALQWMRQFIPGSVLADFDTISSAVATILGALHLDNLVMRAADFIAWIDATYHILETEVHQVLDAFTGAVITPITSRVADFLTWLNNLTGFRTIVDAAVATFTSNFAALISGVGGTVIGDVSSAIAAGVTALARIVSLIAGVGGTTIADVVTAVNNGVTALSQLAALLSGTGQASISALAAFINQITQILQNLGNVFPKTFPWIPGVSTNLTSLAPQVLASDFQQLIDGIAGQANATVAHAVGALQQNTAAVQANVNQAVVDGVHAIESNAQGAAQALQQMFGGLLGLGGSAASSANAAQVAAAAATAYAQAQAQAATVSAINSQLPHFYGAQGTSGYNITVPFAGGTLPASFTTASSIATNSAIYNAATALTDSETVSAFWNTSLLSASGLIQGVTPVNTDGAARYLFFRANTGLTTYLYVKFWAYTWGFNTPSESIGVHVEIGCVVAGFKTVLATDSLIDSSPYYSSVLNGLQTWALEVTGFSIQVSGPGGYTLSVTDSGPVSSSGAAFRSAGIGSDESSWLMNITDWNFYDSGPVAGPAEAIVATQESTASATYVDLATTTDQVTVTIGASGLALVFMSAQLGNSNVGAISCVSFAISGATTQAAADNYSFSVPANASDKTRLGIPFLLTGLAAGASTFKMKYRAGSGTANFTDRSISVIPL